MKVARIFLNGKERYAIAEGAFIRPLDDTEIRDTMGIEKFLVDPNLLSNYQLGEPIAIEHPNVRWLPPLARPGKIICVGRNYLEHIREQGKEPEEKPLLFSKYPGNMVGHETTVPFPKHGKFLDYEVELAVVIGGRIDRTTENPMSKIFGYTIANDLTMRDVQKAEKQWTRGKAFDSSLPIGPLITTKDVIAGVHNVRIWLDVNDNKRQDGYTGMMIYQIPDLLNYIAEAVTLFPGDIVLTGTPSGVGFYMEPIATLKPGDRISSGIENLGELRFSIAPARY